MMFIREALISDLDGIADCAERFFEYAKYAEQGTPFCRGDFIKMVKGYIESDQGIVLLLMDGLYVAGGIAGDVRQWGFNRAIRLCVELFYWVDEPYRGRKSIELLRLYERRAMELGAHKNVMVSVATELQESVNHLYQRMGYQPYEQFFIKSL